ncbi:hypothetical protein KORDIASMS9_04042 [Kordia sp. SMS9]|uniref:restriction endonuclease n=1 Tax=Kordia sp. SMS9 TaxID=2282170 RepID=UPI000E0DCE25|nr:restriction endonuclease [Kordia sp. SMS9]AXG71784.1 hypothetical protein KORDIASMS9_04042 [Kordia sp. SMS9]
MILDFKEIPKANTGNGDQDTFELFSRDFLEILGYEIIQQPDRGADGKKDLIVQESRHGISGVTNIKWLVSCKHYAHSGKSINDSDEPNILDRISVHECDGFLGFYSTLPATSLGKNFEGLKKKTQIDSFDKERIEKIMLESPEGIRLASRYFPISFEKYKVENPKPAKIFADKTSIHCEYCNEDLLKTKMGIFVTMRRFSDFDVEPPVHYPYEKAYYSCKGKCDAILKSKYMQDEMMMDEWVDITDFISPITYIKKLMAWMNSFQKGGEKANDEVFDKLKRLFLNAYPHISREQTTEEKEKVKFYLQNGLMDWL